MNPLGPKETIPQNAEGADEQRLDIPPLKFSVAPTQLRSPPSARHAGFNTPRVTNNVLQQLKLTHNKVVDVSQAVVELLESVKAWEAKGHLDSTSAVQLRTALQLVKTLASENGIF